MAPRTRSSPLAALLAAALFVALPARALAWGGATHHYIAQNYSKHLPPTMDGLRAYDSVVDAHVTDPDTRKSSTPGEAPRHFIDIDTYAEFVFGQMPHSRAQLEAAYGATFVEDTGIVPWAIAEVVGTLSSQFQAGQWSAAALTIADLCHYVGDETQPLHCTKNYDGQLSGNSGIHSRYETTMMSGHIADLSTATATVAFYPNVVDAAFGIVSGSWDKVDDLLAADNTAKAASGGAYNTTYYNSLWASTQAFTRTRIDSATVATASFVYTAWRNAGSPAIPGSSAGVDPGPLAGSSLEAGPSPFGVALGIAFASRGPVDVDVFDVRGRRVASLVRGAAGGGRAEWRPTPETAPGLYFVKLSAPGVTLVRRVTRLR